MASVVINRLATEAASCSAVLTTLVGSTNTGLNHIGIFVGRCIITVVDIRSFQQLTGHNRAVNAGIFGNLADRRLQSAADNVYADALILIGRLNLFQSLGRIQQSRTARRQPRLP